MEIFYYSTFVENKIQNQVYENVKRNEDFLIDIKRIYFKNAFIVIASWKAKYYWLIYNQT